MASPAPSAALAARDLREGGSWSRGQRAKNAVIRGVVRVSVRAADRIPPGLLIALGGLVGSLAWLLLPGKRRRAIAALVEAGIPTPSRAARRSFVEAGRNLARCLLARRVHERASDHVELDGDSLAVLRGALARERGVVFVSAHVGPFEWIAPRVAELGHASSIVVRESYDPRLDAVVDRHRALRGLDVIHRGRSGAALRMLRALRSGRALGILPDLTGRGTPSVTVPFLGAERPVAVGPARLARSAGCPLLTGALAPSDRGRFRLHVQQIEPGADDAETTHRVMAALDAAIRRAPEQWLWMAARPGLQKNRGER